MQRVTDMLGREMELPEKPQRIVSLVPSQTELLYDLGLENEVIGITKFCVHPPVWFRNKRRIGGTKTVHIEQVAELKPDLIIANKEENDKEQIIALEKIAPVWISDVHTLEEAMDMTRRVGYLCAKPNAASIIADKIESMFAALSERTRLAKKYRISKAYQVAYCIWRNPWMWAGGDTFINDMLSRAGLENVLRNVPRYPELSLENLQALNPEVVLLSSEPYPFKEAHIAEIKSVLPDAKVLLADGEIFSWYGSRLLHAPEYLDALLRTL